MASGLVTISGKRYYLDPNNDSKMYTGVKVIDGYVYLFKSGSGDAASGWYKEGDKWYYFNPSTNRLITGFATINSKTYYFDWYMYTGLHKIEGNLYYFDPADDSAMAKNKQIVVEGVTYNAAANGVLTPVNATITDSDVSIVDSEYCTCEPTITVTVGGVELTRGTDYTIAYEPIGNSTIGTATITGIGNYSGTVEKTWTVIHSYYQGECEGCEAVEP